MAHRENKVHGRRIIKGTCVTIDPKMFGECIQTMRTMKREIVVVKEVDMRRLGI